jgi:hypothetical protein
VHDRLGAESGQETTSPAIAIRVGGFSGQYVFLRIDAQMTEITWLLVWCNLACGGRGRGSVTVCTSPTGVQEHTTHAHSGKMHCAKMPCVSSACVPHLSCAGLLPCQTTHAGPEQQQHTHQHEHQRQPGMLLRIAELSISYARARLCCTTRQPNVRRCSLSGPKCCGGCRRQQRCVHSYVHACVWIATVGCS